MKTFNIFFIVSFVIFAALQYNDPDPYIWIPIYLFAAFLCFEAIKGKYNPLYYVAGLTVYVVYAAFLLVDKTGVLDWINQHEAENIAQSMEPDKPWIEETREFFGLLIVIIVLLINSVYFRKRIRNINGQS